MAAVEWALLAWMMAADPGGRLSVLLIVSTVLVVFALAATAIARATATVHPKLHPVASGTTTRRATSVPAHPDPSRLPMCGRPGPRAPGMSIDRSVRAI